MSRTATPTLTEIQDRLAALHARTGFEGRLTLTVGPDARDPCRVVHWTRGGAYAPERWRVVATGSLEDCLAALDLYTRGRAADLPVPSVAAE